MLTWMADVLSVISLASRAFALLYGIRCVIAAQRALRAEELKHRGAFFADASTMALMCLAVTVLKVPTE